MMSPGEREEAVLRLMPVVEGHARHYSSLGGDYEELYAEGLLELVKASHDWTPACHWAFYSYASRRVWRRMIASMRIERDATTGQTRNTHILTSRYPDAYTIVHRHQCRRLLRRGMPRLTPSERRAVELIFEQGMTLTEAAREFDCFPQWVDVLKQGACFKLRQGLPRAAIDCKTFS